MAETYDTAKAITSLILYGPPSQPDQLISETGGDTAELSSLSFKNFEDFLGTDYGDLIDPRDPILPRMAAIRAEFGGSVVCLMEVPRESISLYGCPAIETTDSADVVLITDLIEKPDVADAPSSYAVIGRYLLDPAVFDVIRETKPGRGGEIQLTDALRTLASMPADQGGGVRGVVFSGRRYDTGDRITYLQAVITLAVEREDLGPELREWLTEFVAGLK